MRAGYRPVDDVRLLVSWRSSPRLVDTTFGAIPEFLNAGDLLVVNTSATLPAAVPLGEGMVLHLSTPLPGGVWVVELRRQVGNGTLPFLDARAGAQLPLPGGGSVEILAPYPADGDHRQGAARGGGVRLWLAVLRTPIAVERYLTEVGHPIRYGDGPARPIDEYQTVFALEPGSAEMPSAGRPFTAEIVGRLAGAGVAIAPIVLHTGVSSQEAGEPPYAERYRVPEATAAAVNETHRAGGRVIAVGTTVTRAIETTADTAGTAHPGAGWTDLVVTPERGVRVVDGLLTGWHEPEATHLQLLEAVAGPDLIARSYAAAEANRYLWHEFGDVHLVLP